MSFNGQLLATGGVAQCLTDSVQVFGADGTYSSNIAVYEFNGDATDTTGTYDGTESGTGSPTYVTGKYGQAISFNNDYQFVNTGITPSILGNSFSFSAWVYFTSYPGGGDYYGIAGAYAAGSGGAGAGQPQSWFIYMTSTGAFTFFSNLTSGSVFFAGGTITLNQWNFVAFSVDDQNEISLYLNGNQTTQSVSNSLNGNNVALCLGNPAPYNSSRGMIGLMDQARVFDREITSSEANTLYNETNATTSNTNLFNEGAGVALYTMDYDASDAGGLYDGTPTDVTFGVGGQINTAAMFNGSSSIIKDVLGSGFTYAGKTMTFSAWIFVTDNTNDNMIIGDGLATSTGGWGISTGYGGAPNTRLSFSIASAAIGGVQQTYSSVSVADDTWTHIVVSVDFSSVTDSIKMYINGTEDTSLVDGISGSFVENTTYNTSIGGTWTGVAARLFEGSIDQVRVFSKALNQSEVDTLYTETACNYTCTTDTVNYPTTNLAYYKLDNSADDETGVYDGASTDVLYTFGRFNQAAVFNGSSSYIDIPITPSSLGELFSVSIWFKTSTTSTYQTLVDNGGNTSGSSGFAIFINTDNTLRASFTNGGGGGASDVFTLNTNTTVTDGNWHNCILTYNNESAKLYLDNGTPFSGTNTEPFTQAANNIRLGAYVLDNTILEFNGDIDQVRVFSSELTSSQVTELYNEKPCADTSTFAPTLYDGNSNSAGQYVSNVGFQPDLTWIKYTNANIRHLITDSITGPSVYQGAGITNHSNETFTSNTYGEFTSFDTNGFIVQYWSGSQYFNTTGRNYVAWNWKGGGAAVLNQNGGTNSQVSANTAAGFSIVNWSGDNSTTTIGHGLNSAPEVVIRKNLGISDWAFDTTAIDGSFDYLFLNTSAQKANHTSLSAPTSTVFSTGGTAFNSSSMIAYCWHSVAGKSSISTYEGDGTNDNSKQITGLGFDPSFVMVKNVDSAGGNWEIIDTARGGGNNLYANESYSQNANTPASYGTGQFISGGFSVTRGSVSSSVQWNKSGDTYLYMAFK